MLRHKPKDESTQATLARVKKEMNEPREVESVREEEAKLDHEGAPGKAGVTQRGKHSRGVPAQADAPEAGE